MDAAPFSCTAVSGSWRSTPDPTFGASSASRTPGEHHAVHAATPAGRRELVPHPHPTTSNSDTPTPPTPPDRPKTDHAPTNVTCLPARVGPLPRDQWFCAGLTAVRRDIQRSDPEVFQARFLRRTPRQPHSQPHPYNSNSRHPPATDHPHPYRPHRNTSPTASPRTPANMTRQPVPATPNPTFTRGHSIHAIRSNRSSPPEPPPPQ